LMRIYIAD